MSKTNNDYKHISSEANTGLKLESYWNALLFWLHHLLHFQNFLCYEEVESDHKAVWQSEYISLTPPHPTIPPHVSQWYSEGLQALLCDCGATEQSIKWAGRMSARYVGGIKNCHLLQFSPLWLRPITALVLKVWNGNWYNEKAYKGLIQPVLIGVVT